MIKTEKPLKYLGYTVACQEVPDEVSLIINISGCPHCCEGCHSQQLWKYEGQYIRDDIQKLINKYPRMITCVCFMGGDQNINELNLLLKLVKENQLKTCVYSGYDTTEIFDLSLIDYLKVGHFDINKGGLISQNTNQHFYRVDSQNLIDITQIFFKEE